MLSIVSSPRMGRPRTVPLPLKGSLSFHCLSRYPERLLVMLQAYFDESGRSDNRGFLIVAGYISDVARWNLWSGSWTAFLATHGINALHMAKFDQLIDPCERDNTKLQIARIIRTYIMCGFAVSIYDREYRQLTSPQFRSSKGSAYTLCVQKCIELAMRWAEGNRPDPSEPIAFVFDRGHRNQNQAQIELQKIRRTSIGHRRPHDTFAFEDDQTTVQLQSADVLAYSAWQMWRRRNSPIPGLVDGGRGRPERYHFTPDRIDALYAEYERLRRRPWMMNGNRY
jgi:hypothetical protein